MGKQPLDTLRGSGEDEVSQAGPPAPEAKPVPVDTDADVFVYVDGHSRILYRVGARIPASRVGLPWQPAVLLEGSWAAKPNTRPRTGGRR